MPPNLFVDTEAVLRLAHGLRRAGDGADHLAGAAGHALVAAGLETAAPGDLRRLEERLTLAGSLLAERARLAAAFRFGPGDASGFALAAPRSLEAHRAHRVAKARDVLDDAGLGRLRATLAGLTASETEEVVAGRTDAQWLDTFARLRRHGGWSRAERLALYALVGERVSLASWRRLGALEPEIEPSVDAVRRRLPALRGNGLPTAYGLGELRGPLAVAGRFDADAFAPDDGAQGFLGDCYLWASMQAMAAFQPGRLAGVFRPNANGTVTVTFADGGRVVVDPRFLVDTSTGFTATGPPPGEADAGDDRELWALALEKAYAVRRGGWSQAWGGQPGEATREVLGGRVEKLRRSSLDPGELAARLDAGDLLFVSTADDLRASEADRRAASDGSGLTRQHAYWVSDVDVAAGTVSLRNPWFADGRRLVLTIEALRRAKVSVRAHTLAPSLRTG